MANFNTFKQQYGPWGLVTGASTGIGEAFAHQIAARGLNVVLIARGKERLEQVARVVREQHGVDVRIIAADLSQPGFLEHIREQTQDLEIGLLVNNAGNAVSGAFLDHNLDEELDALAINTRAPLMLTHEFVSPMRDRKRGGVIFLGSTLGYAATPNLSSYAAAKSFNLLLGEGLWYELKQSGIDSLTLSPGPTRTPMQNSMMGHTHGMPGVPALAPDVVATSALNALGRQPSVIPGFRNQMMATMMQRFLPRRVATTMAGQLMNRFMKA